MKRWIRGSSFRLTEEEKGAFGGGGLLRVVVQPHRAHLKGVGAAVLGRALQGIRIEVGVGRVEL